MPELTKEKREQNGVNVLIRRNGNHLINAGNMILRHLHCNGLLFYDDIMLAQKSVKSYFCLIIDDLNSNVK